MIFFIQKRQTQREIAAQTITTNRQRQAFWVPIFLTLIMVSGCKSETGRADAYGNFEADETLISAELGGKLLRFTVEEGMMLKRGVTVAQVDTIPLDLQRQQLRAQQQSVSVHRAEINAQVDVIEAQKDVAEIERTRVEKLLAREAIPQKQWDDINGQISVLDRQIVAVRVQSASIEKQYQAIEAQIRILDDQIKRASVVNPVDGTVLESYAEAFEMTAPGKPLYKIASLDTLNLRAFISGRQLPSLKLGQEVDVLVDGDTTTFDIRQGRVTWISSEAAFTPKPIQTREERVDLVYAFKVRVPNIDGLLKIGMPGEVKITRSKD